MRHRMQWILAGCLVLAASGCQNIEGERPHRKRGFSDQGAREPSKGDVVDRGNHVIASSGTARVLTRTKTESLALADNEASNSNVVIQEIDSEGKVLRDIIAMDDGVQQLAEDPKSGLFYMIDHHAVSAYDLASKTRTELDISQCDPEVSWLSGVAFDQKRQRVVVSSFGGDGHLCAYDVQNKSWTLLGTLENRDVGGLVYHPDGDEFLACNAYIGSSPQVATCSALVRIKAEDGVIDGELSLTPALTLYNVLWGGANQLKMVGDSLMVFNVFSGSYRDNEQAHTALSEIDLATGSVKSIRSTLDDLRNEFATELKPETGTVVIFANYDGGEFTIDVDEDIKDLQIGIVSYEPVKVTIKGTYAANVKAVHYAGFQESASIAGVESGKGSSAHLPDAPYSDPAGSDQIVCMTAADTSDCNTAGQVMAYFAETLSADIRRLNRRYGAYSGELKISQKYEEQVDMPRSDIESREEETESTQ